MKKKPTPPKQRTGENIFPSANLQLFHVLQMRHCLDQLRGEELRHVDAVPSAVSFCRHGNSPLLAAPKVCRQGGQMLAASLTQRAMKVRLQGVGAFVSTQLYLFTCGHDMSASVSSSSSSIP